MIRERCARGVAHFALAAMLVLFARTVVWVLDGLMMHPPEIRFLGIAVFFVAGATLWQILEFRQYARRAFIFVATFTWCWALVNLIREYGSPAPEYGQLQAAEYLLFVGWTVVSALFVAYLFQPHVRALFTEKPANAYQRVVFVLFLTHGLYFSLNYEGTSPSQLLSVSLTPASVQQTLDAKRFQRDCEAQESGRLPASALTREGMLSAYCECDSKVLARHCPGSLQSRRECVDHLNSGVLKEREGAVNLIRDQEACVAEFFPRDADAIYRDRRRRVERQLVGQLSVSLPLAELVDGEEAQSKLVHCLTVSLLSRCEDPKVSETLKCLGQTDYVANVESLQKRCLSLASSAQGDYEEQLSDARKKENLENLDALVKSAPERPEGYLLRGEWFLEQGKYKSAVEDFTIVEGISEFPFTRMRTLRLRRRAYLATDQAALALQDAREGCMLGAADLCREADMPLPESQLSLGGEEAVRLMASAVLKDYPEAGVAARKMLPSRLTADDRNENPEWDNRIQMVEIALGTGDWKRAEELLPKALEVLEDAKRREAVGALYKARISKAKGKPDVAGRAIQKSTTGWKELQDSERGQLVALTGAVAKEMLDQKNWQEAETLLLHLWGPVESSRSPVVKDVNEHLFAFYRSRNRVEKMESYLRREVEIFEALYGAQDPRTDASRNTLAGFYREVGRNTKAAAILAPAVGLDLSRKADKPALLE